MKRALLSFSLAFSILFLLSPHAKAQLLVVRKDGEVVWKVLSSESETVLPIPRASRIEIKDLPSAGTAEPRITLSKKGEKISMLVDEGVYEKELDISQWKDKVVELEERAEIQKLTIELLDDRFAIRQRGVVALTDYPINIDPKRAELSVETESGVRIVSILPFQAAESLLRAKLVTNIRERMELLEKERELTYKIGGVKIINLFNLYRFPVNIEAEVSASTGEILSYDSPIWYKVIGFLFS